MKKYLKRLQILLLNVIDNYAAGQHGLREDDGRHSAEHALDVGHGREAIAQRGHADAHAGRTLRRNLAQDEGVRALQRLYAGGGGGARV